MSFGMRTRGDSGEIIFDSTSKKIYTLEGKLILRFDPSSGDHYANPPTKYTPDNSVFVVKLLNWSGTNGARSWVCKSLSSTSLRRLVIRTRVTGSGKFPEYPNREVYVYTTLPLSTTNSFGVSSRDSSGVLDFTSENSSMSLQVLEQINYLPSNGVVGNLQADGIIINSSPTYNSPSSVPSYYDIRTAGYSLNASGMVNVTTGLVVDSRPMPGGFNFPHFSVTTVKLPDFEVPIIPW